MSTQLVEDEELALQPDTVEAEKLYADRLREARSAIASIPQGMLSSGDMEGLCALVESKAMSPSAILERHMHKAHAVVREDQSPQQRTRRRRESFLGL